MSSGEFTACGMCGDCAVSLPAGFNSKYERYCTRFAMYVDALDGCTFGNPGEPIWATEYPRADVSLHAAVSGYYEDKE